MPKVSISLVEGDSRAVRRLRIDRERHALVRDVPQHQRLRRSRTDAEFAGNGFRFEQSIDAGQLGRSAPDRPNRGDEAADERARKPTGGHLDNQQVSGSGRRRREVPDRSGLVARQVVKVVFARESSERLANAVVVDAVTDPTGIGSPVAARVVARRRVQVIPIRSPSRVVRRMEPLTDVSGGPNPDRARETTSRSRSANLSKFAPPSQHMFHARCKRCGPTLLTSSPVLVRSTAAILTN